MPERSVGRRKKLIGFLSLLLGRCRKGKYDLVGAANGGGGQVQWDTEPAREHSYVRSHKSFFSRRRGYDVAKTQTMADQQLPLSLGSYRKNALLVSKNNMCSNNSAYVAALYHEGLLQWPYDTVNKISNHLDSSCLPEVTEHPVLALCYGFRDQELRENSRRPTRCQTSPLYQFDIYLDSWVQSGLNHILTDEMVHEEPVVDNMPVSLWMAVIEPALQALLTYRFGRNKRLNITSKRQQTPINSLHNASVRGDSTQQDLMLIGPPNQNWALGLVAVFAVRIGELGERQHRYIASAHITDVRIPDLSPEARPRNKQRAKTTRTSGPTDPSTDPDTELE